jgi:hypothetical protein
MGEFSGEHRNGERIWVVPQSLRRSSGYGPVKPNSAAASFKDMVGQYLGEKNASREFISRIPETRLTNARKTQTLEP